jgi:hypothetical protein
MITNEDQRRSSKQWALFICPKDEGPFNYNGLHKNTSGLATEGESKEVGRCDLSVETLGLCNIGAKHGLLYV